MILIQRILILMLFCSSVALADWSVGDLTTPEMNGCTSSPDGTWKHCCDEHDLLYWAGGSFEERLAADERLGWCIDESGGPGLVYFQGVRAGGLDFWSKAWPGRNIVPNSELTREEIQAIEDEHELWVLLNRPVPYDRPVLESLKFPSLTGAQMTVLSEKFTLFRQSEEFKKFHRAYTEKMGEEPQLSF